MAEKEDGRKVLVVLVAPKVALLDKGKEAVNIVTAPLTQCRPHCLQWVCIWVRHPNIGKDANASESPISQHTFMRGWNKKRKCSFRSVVNKTVQAVAATLIENFGRLRFFMPPSYVACQSSGKDNWFSPSWLEFDSPTRYIGNVHYNCQRERV